MSSADYGIYRLSFTPPASTGQEDYPNIAIEMSTGGDASVDQMLRFFEAFLAAAGYVLKGDLQVVEPLKDPWEGHYGSKAVGGSQATDFVISSDTSVATDIFNYSPSGIPGPHPPFGDDYSHLLNFK